MKRSENWKTLLSATLRGTVCLGIGILSLASLRATAADVTLTTGDSYGQHSFDTAGHWDSGAAPSPGNNYYTGPYILRSPTSGTSLTFNGDSLTISPGGSFYDKVGTTTITINSLTNSGSVVNGVGGVFTLAGTMFVPGGGGTMDTGSGNSSDTDNRTISCDATVSGTGAVTNWTSDGNWASLHPSAQGTVIYTGDNTAFTGAQVVMNNTIIQVGSQANLGGNPSTFNPEQLTLNNGILRPSASFSLNNSNSGITIGANGGQFDIASGIFLTNAEALAGTGNLSLTNTGTLVQLGSATNFTGTLSVGGGTLVLGAGGSLAGANTILIKSGGTFDVSAAGFTLADGQTLAGNGAIVGTVTNGSGSMISPAGSGVAGSLAVANLSLNDGGTIVCDFFATNDVVVVSGNLSASGVTSIQLNNVPDVGTYPLITVGGTLGGSSANFKVSALATRNRNYSVIYDTSSTPERVLLQVSSSGAAANLVWQGDTSGGGNNAWDINNTANWLNGGSSDVYFDGDVVNFTDVGVANPPTLDTVVNPSAVNFNSSSSYTLTSPTGNGDIAGLCTLSKGGTGTVTLSVTNTYSGGTIVTNGVLQLGVPQALGSPSGETPLANVSSTGTLDINGAALDALYTNVVQINGNGSSATQGAIDNTVGGLNSGGGDIGIGTLVVNGDSTVTVNQNWQVGNTGQGIVGNGHTLTVRSPNGFSFNNYLYLKSAAASALGNLVIDGAGVLFWDHPDAAGLATTITLTNGGAIDTWNPATYYQGLTFYNPIVVSDSVNGGMIMSVRSPFNHPGADIYNGNVTLNGPLTFTNTSHVNANTYNNNTESFGSITMNGNISGTGGINAIGGLDNPVIVGSAIYGGNLVNLTGNNSYSGPTMVSNLVQLLITTANQSGGSYNLVNYGTLDVAVAAAKPTIPMSSLTLDVGSLGGGGNIGFTRLTQMPTVPVIYATNLTINSAMILPPKAGYSTGQFPLIKYDGTIGGSGFSAIQLGNLPAGVTASLVDNTTDHTIDLSVTTAGIKWTGSQSTNWDYATENWFDPSASAATYFVDGQSVVFGDSASSFNINLQQLVQPGGITVNSSHDYTFSADQGAGISGSSALIKNGSGTLTVSCTNDTFTGGTFINGGTIKLADKNYAYPYGGGALNNNLGTVAVANGGTLDINGVQVPNYQSYGPEGYNVFISGAGAGGNGALVNNNTNDNDVADPGYVTLTGDATVGGPGDINIRMGVSPQLTSQSSDYTLTKVGTGSLRIRYVATVSTNFGPINILGGVVSYESSSIFGMGDPTKNIYVGSGAGFAWGTAAAACVRPLICSNNASIYGYNITTNVFNSPVTLVSGNVNLNANYYNGMIFSNVLSGAGGVTVQYQSYITFAAANTYSGDTIVANCGNGPGSLLRLIGNGSINDSADITLLGITTNQAYAGALDVSGRTDGTLTLGSGQTLRGDNGSYVNGNVIAASGATIVPGGATNIQYMTFSNNLTMSSGSMVAMDVSLDAGVTNDLINVAGTNHYDGTLELANVGSTALTNGSSFKLFNAAHFSGNFASISGSPGAGMTWSFDPTNGVATVVAGGAATSPSLGMSLAGDKLTLTWPQAYQGYTLQMETNPLTAGLTATNWVDVPGSSSGTNSVITIDPTMPTVFYRLRQ